LWPRSAISIEQNSTGDRHGFCSHAILAERGAHHINVNTLKFFSEPGTLNVEAKSLLRRALSLAMEWADKGLVVPHIGKTINSGASEINDGLQAMKMGKSPMGKVAVVVDSARESR
jgi:hypothetical protein